MANTVGNVSAGKPKVGGAFYVAPKGTTAPTDSTSTLASAFKCMGYISEDGVVLSTSRETDEVRAWGGDIILNPQTAFTDTVQCTMVESVNIDVLKVVYGSSNVSGTLTGSNGLTVQVNSKELDEWVVVVETITRGGGTRREVYPQAKPTELGEVTLNDSDPIGYEVTFTAYPDSSGNTHYIYAKETA